MFGPPGHDLILTGGASCQEVFPCVDTGLVLFAHGAKAIAAALLFGLVAAFLPTPRFRRAVGLALWTLQYLWSLVGMASGYRGNFGTTWLWWEPFAELLFSPALTLGLGLGGLALFAWLTHRT